LAHRKSHNTTLGYIQTKTLDPQCEFDQLGLQSPATGNIIAFQINFDIIRKEEKLGLGDRLAN